MKSNSAMGRALLAWSLLALIGALVAAVMVVGAGPLYKHESIGLGTAFGLLRHGAWVGIFTAAAALLGLFLTLLLRRWKTAWLALAALVIGLGTFIGPYMMLQDARAVPPIHDIATNPMHAPRFTALATVRAKAPNGLDYGGGGERIAKQEQGALAQFLNSPAGRKNPRYKDIANDCKTWGPICLTAVQHAYYPDIQPLQAPGIAPQSAYKAALKAARAMGWKIVDADASMGHIEATATTAWFGFKDDIAIDVMPDNSGSVINVRSESRLGLSDLGKNAKRVRAYLKRAAHQLNQLHKD